MKKRWLRRASICCLLALAALVFFCARATATGREYSIRAFGWRCGVVIGGSVPMSMSMVSGSRVLPSDSGIPDHEVRINGRQVYHNRMAGAGVEFVRGMTSLAPSSGPVVMHYWTFQLPLFYPAAAMLVLPAWWLLRNCVHRGRTSKGNSRDFERKGGHETARYRDVARS